MAVIQATLIVKGKKNFADVPERIKEQVKEVLIDLDCGELAEQSRKCSSKRKNTLYDRYMKSCGVFFFMQKKTERR